MNLIKSSLYGALSILMLQSCQEKKEISSEKKTHNNSLIHSKNVLNFLGTPKNPKDREQLMFSDQGAWFAYSIPDTLSNYGGFSGPFLMTQQNGIWASKNIAQLKLQKQNKDIQWELIKSESYNSHLLQELQKDSIKLENKLVFASGHTVLIQAKITNNSSQKIELQSNWQGELMLENLELSKSNIDSEIQIKSSQSSAIGHLFFPEKYKTILGQKGYKTESVNLNIDPKQSITLVSAQAFIFPQYDWTKELEYLSNPNYFKEVLKIRQKEKNRELNHVISLKNPNFKDSSHLNLLAKTQLTLQNNWRIPAGELKTQGLFPSYHYKWFHGFWAWDSWKHAVGLSKYKPSLAKDQVRAMFDYQSENGFILDCAFRDISIEPHNTRDTKPPLGSWAVYKIYQADKDLNFLKELYPKLQKYHDWWYKNRDHDQDGLCEYGSTDGSLIAAKWESGMDNAVRFDDSKILQNKQENAYSLDQESVDLNAYLYADKQYLQKIAKLLGNAADSEKYQNQAEELKNRIQTQFYDEETNWFYDTNLEGTKHIKVMGCEGWIPLWANVATPKQAEGVKNNMMDSTKFFTKTPLQTLSADHPKFNPLDGYWRGPNWLDQSYFGVIGLKNYQFQEQANKISHRILSAEGILQKGPSIRENYHPTTGEGLNAQNFSWSAAHLLLLLTE